MQNHLENKKRQKGLAHSKTLRAEGGRNKLPPGCGVRQSFLPLFFSAGISGIATDKTCKTILKIKSARRDWRTPKRFARKVDVTNYRQVVECGSLFCRFSFQRGLAESRLTRHAKPS